MSNDREPTAMDEEFDRLFVIETEDCEVYRVSEGILIYIGRCDQFSSMGFIELDQDKETEKRARPADGFFKQSEGKIKIMIFYGDNIEEKVLSLGETIKIEANTPYIIGNASNEKSLTSWRFDGDIREVIDEIIKKCDKVTAPPREKSSYKELYKQHVEARKSWFDKIKGK